MKTRLLAMLLLINGAVFAQEKGMQFTHAASWEEVKAKAKAENKFIFVDAFTTWCGPCKIMSKDIFPLETVGGFYNANYINVKVQMDQTKDDNDLVKGWYEDAKKLGADYNVRAYPTYLFFSPDGEIVHRAVGSSPAEVFIEKGKAAIDPAQHYYTQLKRFHAGDRDTAFLLRLAKSALGSYDSKNASEVVGAYLKTQPDLLNKPTLQLLISATSSPADPGFKILREQGAVVDSILGRPQSAALVKQIVTSKVLQPALYPEGVKEPQWDKAAAALKTDYADIAGELLSSSRMFYALQQKDWPAFRDATNQHLAKYRSSVREFDLNEFAWSVFQHCDDKACLEAALAWSKESLKPVRQPQFPDTYANLLYKMGKKAEAIKIQEEAAKADGGPEYRLRLKR
ncbi:thioredoxin family protein [Chitinophaga sedimenti]|uniref:thioredoxin family protein n=1 Tax=Chitinophaga sedimenti TaxID=2033606 RepID=UPI0020044EDB|nr:thioredoxin family protein [Chitinophaga sedimenti]MCK7556038.1 thioredoxin family protein [Chitinophaga sedimenti]